VQKGTLCIIDTESNYDVQLEVKGYLRLLGYGHNPGKDFSEDALKLLFKEMKRLLELEENQTIIRQTVSTALEYLSQYKPHQWDYIAYFRAYFAKFL
jgi:hypothetical protein